MSLWRRGELLGIEVGLDITILKRYEIVIFVGE